MTRHAASACDSDDRWGGVPRTTCLGSAGPYLGRHSAQLKRTCTDTGVPVIRHINMPLKQGFDCIGTCLLSRGSTSIPRILSPVTV